MRNSLIVLLSLLFFAETFFAGSITEKEANEFITLLLTNSEKLSQYFDSSEVRISERLGITYPGKKFKLLISNDIDAETKHKILTNELKYSYEIISPDSIYSELIIKIPGKRESYNYYFRNSKMISRPTYFSRNMKRYESEYFVFYISDSTLANDYSMKRLDSFVDCLLGILECGEKEKRKLREEKIWCFLCRDNEEIKKLTGYSARGLYYIPNDYIISTFNCHYHEIAHLLINYKLKNPDLYTHPLLQEGFAVAFGGRGGKEPEIILKLGAYMAKSGFFDYKMMIEKKDFSNYDASLTYPVAGLYVKFLIEKGGIKNFLNLYTDYSSPNWTEGKTKISANDDDSWKKFLSEFDSESKIRLSDFRESDFKTITEKEGKWSIAENERDYLFKVKDHMLIAGEKKYPNYQSKKITELLPDMEYKGEKYLITADGDEISLYNLFTNNLIAKYVRGFSAKNIQVPQKEGYYQFVIPKDLIEDNIKK